MTVITDSDAALDSSRIFAQHQAAVTLLSARLQSPTASEVHWLDLACGKGQIIAQLDHNISAADRKRIHYYGYDANVTHAKNAKHLASKLSFATTDFCNGDICNFSQIVNPQPKFDFVTCTNAIHEIPPRDLASLFTEVILRLSDDGDLFIYDRESLAKHELAAIPWKGDEAAAVFNAIIEALGSQYRVRPSIWRHTSCRGWSILIKRELFDIDRESAKQLQAEAIDKASQKVSEILGRNREFYDTALRAYSEHIDENSASDEQERITALYNFWSLSHALRDVK